GVVADCRPGGIPPGGDVPVMRSPLADVADLLWSLHRAALAATADRDPADRAVVVPLADAWETRNRRAFMTGYLATPGIGGLLPTNRDHVLALIAAFELAREAGAAGAGGVPGAPGAPGRPGTVLQSGWMRIGVLTGRGDCPGL